MKHPSIINYADKRPLKPRVDNPSLNHRSRFAIPSLTIEAVSGPACGGPGTSSLTSLARTVNASIHGQSSPELPLMPNLNSKMAVVSAST